MRTLAAWTVFLGMLLRLPFLLQSAESPPGSVVAKDTAAATSSYTTREQSSSSNIKDTNTCAMSMTMYMQGFQRWTPDTCLNFLVHSWILSTRQQLYGAVMFAFSMSFILEWTSQVRRVILKASTTKTRHRHFFLTVIYTLQALLGYLIMLITMSYSVELIVALLVGLAVGNFVFHHGMREHDKNPPGRGTGTANSSNNDTNEASITTPLLGNPQRRRE